MRCDQPRNPFVKRNTAADSKYHECDNQCPKVEFKTMPKWMLLIRWSLAHPFSHK